MKMGTWPATARVTGTQMPSLRLTALFVIPSPPDIFPLPEVISEIKHNDNLQSLIEGN